MYLAQLNAFILVAKVGHVTKVSEMLNVSQPALSVSIKNLEDEIGVPLFKRQNRSLVLTKYGEVFLCAAQSAKSILESCMEQIHEMKSSDDNNISMISPALYNYPGLLDQIYRSCPDIHIRMLGNYSTPEGLASQIKKNNDELPDLIMSTSEDSLPNYQSRQLRSYPMALVMEETHPLANKETIQLSDLVNERFVCKTSPYGSTQLFLRGCRKAGFEPNIVFESDNSHDQLEVVAHGQAVTLMSYTANNYKIIHSFQNVRCIAIEDPLLERMPLIIYWQKGGKQKPSAKKLIDILTDYFSACSDDPAADIPVK